MQQMGKVATSQTISNTIATLEAQDCHGQLVNGISNFQVDAFLRDLQRASGSRSDCQAFLDRLLELLLDAVLGVLPSVRIPEVTGEYRGVWYKVLDLDMSGLRFDKEDVSMTVKPLTSSGNAEELCLGIFAHSIRGEFTDLKCQLRPRKLPAPHVTVTTNAQALGMCIYCELSLLPPSSCSSQGRRAGIELKALEVTMKSLHIKLVDSSYARLFNPLVDYFSETLSVHICKSLEERLGSLLRECIGSMGELLHDLSPVLTLLQGAHAGVLSHARSEPSPSPPAQATEARLESNPRPVSPKVKRLVHTAISSVRMQPLRGDPDDSPIQ